MGLLNKLRAAFSKEGRKKRAFEQEMKGDTPFTKVKAWLKEEPHFRPSGYSPEMQVGEPCIKLIPILHNPGVIILQMCGWSINLKSDGTWEYEGTEGG